MLKGAWISQSV